jgi:hypothetical protein
VLTGLDIDAKAELFRRQFEAATVVAPSTVDWALARLDRPDAPTKHQASALLTVVARDPDERVAGRAFVNPAIELALGTYPGFFATTPPGRAQPYGVFKAGFVPQPAVTHEAVLSDGQVLPIPPPQATQPLQPLTGVAPRPTPVADETGIGVPTRRVPLGTIVGARSGDKGGSANVGLWTRGDDAYAWLAASLTEREIRALLPEAAGLAVSVTRLPNLRAVNVVIDGLLGAGVAYNARFDPQAKGLGEWLRSRLVDIPESLLPEPMLPESMLEETGA